MPVSRKSKNISSKKSKNVKRTKKTRKHMKKMRGCGSANSIKVGDIINVNNEFSDLRLPNSLYKVKYIAPGNEPLTDNSSISLVNVVVEGNQYVEKAPHNRKVTWHKLQTYNITIA